MFTKSNGEYIKFDLLYSDPFFGDYIKFDAFFYSKVFMAYEIDALPFIKYLQNI